MNLFREIIIDLPRSWHGGKPHSEVVRVEYFTHNCKQDYRYLPLTDEGKRFYNLYLGAIEDIQPIVNEIKTLSGAAVFTNYDFKGDEIHVSFTPKDVQALTEPSYVNEKLRITEFICQQFDALREKWGKVESVVVA